MSKYELKVNAIGVTYVEYNDGGVLRFIPIDATNADYQAYLKHLAENPNG